MSLLISTENREVPAIFSHLLVSAMMVCFAVTTIRLGQHLTGADLGQPWQGWYLLVIALVISLEVLLSYKMLADTPGFSPEWFVQRGAEWLLIVLFVRILVYSTQGIDQILSSIGELQYNFLNNFFTGEYIAALLFAVFVYFMSMQYAQLLVSLEHDTDQLEMERSGYGITDRSRIRKALMGMVFIPGGLLLLMTALIHLNITTVGFSINNQSAPVWNLMLYFVFGLILIGLNRFSALRSYWFIQEIPVKKNLAGRWLLYSLGLIVAVSLISIMLPTRYSVGILTLLNWLLSLLMTLLYLLELLILTPLFYLFRLLASLLGSETTGTQEPDLLPPSLPRGEQTVTPIPWLEVVKSILFWAIFFAVIGLSVYHYVRQREDWTRALKNAPWLRWLAGVWGWISGIFYRANRSLAAVMRESVERVRRAGRRRSGLTAARKLPGSLSDRERILYTYLQFVEENNEEGKLKRQETQTPAEYAQTLDDALPEEKEDIHRLTDTFIEARYTPHPIEPEKVDVVGQVIQHIRSAIRSWKKGG